MTQEQISFIQTRMDYKFRNTELLIQAFTRRSYAEENDGCDNEVLEFIGDKALDFVVVKYLSDNYGCVAQDYATFPDELMNQYLSDYDEGELTQMKAKLVQKKMLAHRVDELGFADFLRLGEGDILTHINERESVKEDLFEAIIGAVAIDSNWDVDAIEGVMMCMLQPDAELEDENGGYNYVGIVQDWASQKWGELPMYHCQEYSETYMYTGPYIMGRAHSVINHRYKYMCYLKIPGIDDIFLDMGDSERAARMNVAEAAFAYIERNDLWPSIKDEISNPNVDDAIGQLEILARRGYFSIPTYEFEESHDEDGNPIWNAKCKIEEINRSFSAINSSKKTAKKQAAYKMLGYVLEHYEEE